MSLTDDQAKLNADQQQLATDTATLEQKQAALQQAQQDVATAQLAVDADNTAVSNDQAAITADGTATGSDTTGGTVLPDTVEGVLQAINDVTVSTSVAVADAIAEIHELAAHGLELLNTPPAPEQAPETTEPVAS